MIHIPKISIASDHNGYDLKKTIIEHLEAGKYQVTDLGTNSPTTIVDYPDYAKLVSDHIGDGLSEIGILICGTGIGMSIAANRSSHIRAALCIGTTMAKFAREHNNANILALGAKNLSYERSIEILDMFLSSQFEGGRHLLRIEKIG